MRLKIWIILIVISIACSLKIKRRNHKLRAGSQISSRALARAPRQYIVKCCGRRSCLATSKRGRNKNSTLFKKDNKEVETTSTGYGDLVEIETSLDAQNDEGSTASTDGSAGPSEPSEEAQTELTIENSQPTTEAIKSTRYDGATTQFEPSTKTTAVVTVDVPSSLSTLLSETVASTALTTTTVRPTTTTAFCFKSSCDSIKYPKTTAPAVPLSTQRLTVCGRVYEIGFQQVALPEAAADCQLKNASLLSLMKITEKQCLLNLFQNLKMTEATFWTGGSQEGGNCSDAKAGALWCSLPENPAATIDPLLWSASQVVTTGADCVAFKLATDASLSGLTMALCSSKMSHVCEPACDKFLCPATIPLNDSLVDANKALIEPAKYCYWVHACGKHILFGNKPVTWDENFAICNSIGMRPLDISSPQMMTCLNNLTSANWKYNFNYWTGGSQRGCKGQWAFCPSGDPVPDEAWLPGQPDNDGIQECVHLRIYDKNKTLGVRLSDRNCTDLYIYACEMLLPSDVKCISATKCPSLDLCKREVFDKSVIFSNQFILLKLCKPSLFDADQRLKSIVLYSERNTILIFK
ncbi:uncharacterized protein LOC132200727 [Neocloeon triangulifer]|uniref:uncharacterized protein LOC132200727 n=1 Tax=Neocloeon triangulifer TaxID=2078957 RepID=UPI00286EF47F|nr:uncharacterized protein LOC132200727 [Neocloeon triangulifer]